MNRWRKNLSLGLEMVQKIGLTRGISCDPVFGHIVPVFLRGEIHKRLNRQAELTLFIEIDMTASRTWITVIIQHAELPKLPPIPFKYWSHLLTKTVFKNFRDSPRHVKFKFSLIVGIPEHRDLIF